MWQAVSRSAYGLHRASDRERAAGGIADHYLLPDWIREGLAAHRTKPTAWDFVSGMLGLPGVVGWIVSIVGLFRFWPSAPRLALVSWIYMLVWMPFSSGPVLTNALDGTFTQCSTLLVGGVLAITFFSPAAEWFQKKPENKIAEQTTCSEPGDALVDKRGVAEQGR